MRRGRGARGGVGSTPRAGVDHLVRVVESCAVAHHVEEVARVGDIDHLVATPQGLWVIETKHGRVPKAQFRETLRRIALNVEAVRDWAPGMRVTGCLVFFNEPKPPPKPTYESGAETIKCFANPTSLMRELRDETQGEGGSSDLASIRLSTAWKPAAAPRSGPATTSVSSSTER